MSFRPASKIITRTAALILSAFAFVTHAVADTNSPALGERSVYQLTSEWTTDTGKRVKLAELHGQPQVVAMIFTSCQGACPILVRQMRELAQSLPEHSRTNVGFLLVTFDVEHDTPKILHAYRAAQKLPEGQWTLLHGKAEDVQELAMVLGVKYRQGANGQFSHSNLITILNAEGEIAWQKNGLDDARDELAKKLLALVNKP